MDSYLMFLNCPANMDNNGAARCGLPAEVHYRYTMNSTGGEPETDCRRSLEQHRTDRRRTTRRPGGRQDDPRASQPGRLSRSTLTAPRDRPGRAGGAARQDPGEGVLPAGGPQVAVRGRD
jgi:hypothetical protein